MHLTPITAINENDPNHCQVLRTCLKNNSSYERALDNALAILNHQAQTEMREIRKKYFANKLAFENCFNIGAIGKFMRSH